MPTIKELVDKLGCYFIADIAANHDGSLERAKDLIYKAKEAGAHVAKFQHFQPDQIVSREGFSSLGDVNTHQSGWKKSVHEVYEQYHTKLEWDAELYSACCDAGIEFMTTPYDTNAVQRLDKYLNSYKIGSGDITYRTLIEKICKTKKNIILATGASDISDVRQAMGLITQQTEADKIALLQCNTNYTADVENFKYINLKVIIKFKDLYPNVTMGLSDHTPGHATVLGAIALGAKVIEKHFTDDNNREGPDHKFAMCPNAWREMVDRSTELLFALGNGEKVVEHNEIQSAIVQRRSIRAAKNLPAGTIIEIDDLNCLRPCTKSGISPWSLPDLIGESLNTELKKGDELQWSNFAK